MLVSLSTLLRGTTYEKLKWTFTLYDLNKDGYITKQEVLNVMVAVHELMGIHASPLVSLPGQLLSVRMMMQRSFFSPELVVNRPRGYWLLTVINNHS